MTQTVLVTGAGSGIGLACAEEFHRSGFDVIGWDLNPGAHDFIQWAEVDVSDWDAVARAGSELPALDAVVTCAGLGVRGSVNDLPADTWRRVMSVNVEGTAWTAMAAFEALKAAQGTLVTIGSITATSVFKHRAHYSASKAAVVMLTKSLANEWAEHGIRTVCVSPGFTRTPMLEESFRSGLTDEAVILAHTPQRTLIETSELARSIRAIASDDFARVTGAHLLVDGGWDALTGF